MILDPKTSDYPQHQHRRLCPTGRRLHQDWLDALETHVPEVIGDAQKLYFRHINGEHTIKRNGNTRWIAQPCFECGPYRTGQDPHP
jgi:hypothetical protein